MSKPKVLISDALSPAAVQIFKDRGVEVDFRDGFKNRRSPEITSALLQAGASKVGVEIPCGYQEVDKLLIAAP